MPFLLCLKYIGLCAFTVLYKFLAVVHSAACMINGSSKQGETLLEDRIEGKRRECGGDLQGAALCAARSKFSLTWHRRGALR